MRWFIGDIDNKHGISIQAKYNNGISVKQIAQLYKISDTTVYRILVLKEIVQCAGS